MKKIGFFDSGIGGLFILDTVAKEVSGRPAIIFQMMPFFLMALKSEKQILDRSCYLTDVLIKEGIKHIVVACNTATAVAIDLLAGKVSSGELYWSRTLYQYH